MSAGFEDPAGDLVPDDDLESWYPQVREQFFQDDPPGRSAALWLIGSAALFLMFSMESIDLAGIGILMGVLLFHELGHLVAMWIFGYRDLKIFFIPFFGAAASGRQRGVAQWKAAIVLLAGPLPGILLALPLAIVDASTDGMPLLGTTVVMLLFINGLNLLPFVPLDGGRLVSLLLFSRSPWLETTFKLVTGGLLAALAFWGEAWLVGAFCVLIVFTALATRRLVAEAHRLRPQFVGAPVDPKALPEPLVRTLYEAAFHLFDAPQRKLRYVATNMRALYERVLVQPPGAFATVLLLGAYAGSWVAVLPSLAIVASLEQVTQFTSSDGLLQVTAPAAWAVDPEIAPDAQLHISNRLEGMYLTATNVPKSSVPEPIVEERSSAAWAALTEAVDGKLEATRTTTIAGNLTPLRTIRGSVDGNVRVYLQAVIESERHYHEIVAWTLPEHEQTALPVLRDIVRTAIPVAETLPASEGQ